MSNRSFCSRFPPLGGDNEQLWPLVVVVVVAGAVICCRTPRRRWRRTNLHFYMPAITVNYILHVSLYFAYHVITPGQPASLTRVLRESGAWAHDYCNSLNDHGACQEPVRFRGVPTLVVFINSRYYIAKEQALSYRWCNFSSRHSISAAGRRAHVRW